MPVPHWLNRSVLFDPVNEYGECVDLSKQIGGLYGCRHGHVTYEQVRKIGINAGQVAALSILRAYIRTKGGDEQDALA